MGRGNRLGPVVGTSRAVAVPGLRTNVSSPGLRSDAATTGRAIRHHPFLLVLGVIGFALRGGIVLLAVPILVLPTAVEVRFLIGNGLGTSGLEPGFFLGVAALSVATLGLALLVLYVIARCELASFTRYVNSTGDSDAHAWLPPGRLLADHRSVVTMRIFIVEAVALLAVLLCAVPLAAAAGQATLQEILLPSSSAGIYTRILNDVSAPLVGWIAAIVVIEALSAIAARRVLARAFGLKPYFRMSHRPLRAVVVALIGWLLFMGALAICFVALTLAWQVVESVFLSTGLSGGLREIVSAVLIAVVFGGLFTAALALCGLVSTVRAGLWTLASLR